MNALQDVASVYASFHSIQQHMVLYAFNVSLQATLSDRAWVNKCVSQQLSDTLGKNLVQLKCHLHPLDGMATQARKELKAFEAEFDINGSCYGSEGRAANLVYAITKLR